MLRGQQTDVLFAKEVSALFLRIGCDSQTHAIQALETLNIFQLQGPGAVSG